MRVLRVPCTDPAAAERANAALAGHYIDTLGTEDRFLLVPSGWSPIFVWDLAEVLQADGYGEDAELAAWAAEASCAVPA